MNQTNNAKSTQETIDILLSITKSSTWVNQEISEQYYKLQQPLFEEIEEEIVSVEIISNRIIALKYTNKSVILYASDDDGDQGCCSQTNFNPDEHPFTSLVGKKITEIKHMECSTYDEGIPPWRQQFNNHTYQITFNNDDNIFTFILYNRSNGYYDGVLATYLCID